MKRGKTGKYEVTNIGGEQVRAFVPSPLPPQPPVKLDGRLQVLMEKSLMALGRLDSLSTLLPDTGLFLYMYVRKEAVLSSQIEGTQSSLSELLLFELKDAPGVPLDEVVEVSNYVAALNHGLKKLRDGLPICCRLIREIHGVLLSHGRGSEKDPGNFRRSQNWIGGSRPGNALFVPPPPQFVQNCMSDLEKFLHADETTLPVLVKAGLSHVQFETIHPFLDGNGRVGRLLIPFLLCSTGALRDPLLYLSLYFKQHRDEYYALLNQVRTEGNWEDWLEFFIEGVRQTSEGAISTAQRLIALFQEDREKIQVQGRAAGSALRVHQVMKEQPITSLQEVCKKAGLSFPAASSGMTMLNKLGIVRELTGKQRNRLFGYDRYLVILSEGTEPLA